MRVCHPGSLAPVQGFRDPRPLLSGKDQQGDGSARGASGGHCRGKRKAQSLCVMREPAFSALEREAQLHGAAPKPTTGVIISV